MWCDEVFVIKKSNFPLYLLLLIFIVPMFVSWYLYHNHQQFHFKTTNRGTLINPVFQYTALNGNEKTWKIFYVSQNNCDSQCENTQHTLLQLQKALGKDRNRIAVKSSNQSVNHFARDRIYLIDPIGNVFMYYPANTDPMNILKDMKHVLEVSQIG